MDAGSVIERRVDVTLLDAATGAVSEAIVSVTGGTVLEHRELDAASAPYGQPQYLFEEYDRAAELVKASPEWRAAMTRRGLADRIDLAFCSPLAPGFTGRADEVGRRVIRSLTFLRDSEDDIAWAHPVEGLIVHIDLTENRVIRIEDEGDVPVPSGSGKYTPDAVGPARESLKPIEITQPEGPSFHVDGSLVEWEKWSMRVGFNAREGLVLSAVTFDGRSVLTRGSVPEMVVPYGDTSPTRFWISYFDAGEYLLGKNANHLELGCDCLGVIRYFDGYVADDHGHAVKIPNVVCMHEEDYGILWKHTEPGTRRRRRAPVAPAGGVVLQHDRQLRLRLLLVLLPGRVDPGRGEGDGHRVRRRGHPGLDEPARTRDRAGRVRAGAPAPLLGTPGHGRSTARTTV